MQEGVGFAVDQPLTSKDKSWTYAVKESGDYQLGLAWVEVESGDNVAVEIFTNGTKRVKALYAPAGEVTRFEARLENLAVNDTITVKVTSNGGRYRAGYQIAFSTPTFDGLPLFDVATYGAVGDGITDDFAAIHAAVTAAKNAGGRIIQFNGAKTYRSIGLDDGTVETLIDLEETENIKIEGNGARVVLHPPDRFTNIRYAENIQVDGFTIDYDPIPYYQGTITDINMTNLTIDIDVPERYPIPVVGAISNQVQTGLGRTGELFAYQHEIDAKPDVLVLGKALGGGVYPVSAALASHDVMSLLTPGDHGSTFGGNPLGAAVGRCVLDVILDERLTEKAAEHGAYLLERIKDLNSAAIRDVRGRGLLIGIEIRTGAGKARDYCARLLERGVLATDTHEQVIRLAPPLTIETNDVDWLLERIAEVL